MIKLNKTGSYKIGLDEINGLEKAMTECKHCGESIRIRDDETTIADPYVGNCPNCGESSESEF